MPSRSDCPRIPESAFSMSEPRAVTHPLSAWSPGG
jgi:hypothetical protein